MIRFAFSVFATAALLVASYVSLSHHRSESPNPLVQVADGPDCYPGDVCIVGL